MSAVVYIIGVVIVAVLVNTDNTYESWPCDDRECKRTAYNSFPWLTTVGPGGLVMMFVAWVARSEPEELDEDEEREDVAAGLPQYSLVGPGSPRRGSLTGE